MPKKRTARRRKRRPGYPRKSNTLNRITVRMRQSLYDAMNTACEEQELTQREFIERGIVQVLDEPEPITEGAQDGDGVARTGMWIDPALVRLMDKRIRKDDTTQRAIIERAVAVQVGAVD